jgi:hypothetical protein
MAGKKGVRATPPPRGSTDKVLPESLEKAPGVHSSHANPGFRRTLAHGTFADGAERPMSFSFQGAVAHADLGSHFSRHRGQTRTSVFPSCMIGSLQMAQALIPGSLYPSASRVETHLVQTSLPLARVFIVPSCLHTEQTISTSLRDCDLATSAPLLFGSRLGIAVVADVPHRD